MFRFPNRNVLRVGSKRRWLSESKSKSNRSLDKDNHNDGDGNLQISQPRFKFSSLGMFAGVLGSLAGMGGGFIIIPILTSKWFRISQHKAHGTSLFAVAGMRIVFYSFFIISNISSGHMLKIPLYSTISHGYGRSHRIWLSK